MKKNKNVLIAIEMGTLSAEMDKYHNAVDVYARYLEKLEDPNEDKEIIEGVLECIERYMKIQKIEYKETLNERRLIEKFVKERAAANGISERDYCKRFGLRHNRI